MGKHTPGPWAVDKDLLVYCKTDYLITCDITERSYGLVASLSVMNEDSLGNAQLIAAAPEMLEALKGALAALERADDYGVPGLGRVIDTADAAIAKAEGEL